MIKVNELRLGNIVQSDVTAWEDLGLVTVCSIEHDSINSGAIREEDMHPIPITEEWLRRFGFYRNIEKNQFELFTDGFASKLPIWLYREEWYIAPMGDDTGFMGIEYIHQLQNLYFTLSKKDLHTIE